MNALKNYRAFQARKKIQLSKIKLNELDKVKFDMCKLDTIENEMHKQALDELKLIQDEVPLQQPRNQRRYKIFQSFRAGDYLNEVTRSSIIQSLVNANKQ